LKQFGDGRRHILGRGVALRKRGKIVQMTVMHWIDDMAQPPFQLVKVHHHANRVEPGGSHANAHMPVMAVQRLQRPVIQAQLMGSRKIAGDGDLEWHVGS
jgi:hypothetical protein